MKIRFAAYFSLVALLLSSSAAFADIVAVNCISPVSIRLGTKIGSPGGTDQQSEEKSRAVAWATALNAASACVGGAPLTCPTGTIDLGNGTLKKTALNTECNDVRELNGNDPNGITACQAASGGFSECVQCALTVELSKQCAIP